MSDEEYWRALHPAVRLAARAVRARRPVPLEELGAEFDRVPGPDGVTDSIVVAASQRTGSNLLVYTLRAAGYGSGEEFWTDRVMWGGYVRWGVPAPTWHGLAGQVRRAARGDDRWWLHRRFTSDDFVRYHRLVEAHRTTPNGVFVAKLFRRDVEELEQRNGLLPADVFRGRQHWVHLTRSDRIGQAISFFRAIRTKTWIDKDGPGRPFDPTDIGQAELAEIRSRVDWFEQADVWWEQQFDRYGVTALRIDYDDLNDRLTDAVNAVITRVGGEPVPDLAPATKVQRDQASEIVRERLVARYPELAERA
jgi:LPS sulfotransferase NodH